MGMNTFRYHRWRERIGGDARPGAAGPGRRWSLRHGAERERNPLAAMYWRRRLVALALGLSVLAVIAWAFNGAIGGAAPSGPSAASGSGSGQGRARAQGPGQGQGREAPGVAERRSSRTWAAGAAATAGSAARREARRRRGPRPGAGDSSGSGSGQSGTTATPGPCPHGAVVLSLINAQPTYGPGELPQFTVDVVGTGRQTCSFNVGRQPYRADHPVRLRAGLELGRLRAGRR